MCLRVELWDSSVIGDIITDLYISIITEHDLSYPPSPLYLMTSYLGLGIINN